MSGAAKLRSHSRHVHGWAIVLLAFFVLAVQLFVTLIEFKLTVLCGFVLIPFGLFGKTAFMAERVLGNVVSSGIKVLVLAVIVGIGSTLFSEFTDAIGNAQPTIEDAMAIVLGALCLFGLGVFGPGIASGIVSGGPQLGAGAAAGTALAAGGVITAGAAAGGAALGAAGGALAGAGRTVSTATIAYRAGAAGKSGMSGVASGLGNVGRTAAQSAMSPLRRAAGGSSSGSAGTGAGPAGESGGGGGAGGSPTVAVERDSGGVPMPQTGAGPVERDSSGVPLPQSEASQGAPASVTSEPPSEAVSPPPDAPRSEPPAWARSMRRHQAIVHGASVATHTLHGGDSRGPGASVSVTDKE